jgi:alkanesulfonate monooxygenase SsuD/methylene tetrahydromethanopterin reductase-like flavin-dependent oxidoreductase (luciferase family)
MPVAVSLATRSGVSAGTVGDLAAAAERAGLSGFYLAESAADSLVLSQAALAATRTIAVGTAIANARLRHPAAAAMATATLDELFRGRFKLGLGVSNAAFNEGVLGMPAVPPVEFMRDYVAGFRRTLAGPLDRPPVNARPLISLAAMGPRMLRLAGEVADGVILSLTGPASVSAALTELATGAARAGRPLSEVVVACVVPCCFDEDEPAAQRAGRNVVLGYARHPAAARIFAERGFADRLPPMVAALERGDTEAAHRLVDEGMVAEFVLVDPNRCGDLLAAFARAGVDQSILFPVPSTDDWEATLRHTINLLPDLLSQPTVSERV